MVGRPIPPLALDEGEIQQLQALAIKIAAPFDRAASSDRSGLRSR
jgi:hypothetical protein